MSRIGGGMCVAAAAAAVLVCSVALADVATPRPQWTDVQMKSEAVNISLGAKAVKVEATFQMVNHGKAEDVLFGYPLGEFEKKLNDLKVAVDGKDVKVATETPADEKTGPPMRSGPAKGGKDYRFAGPYKQWYTFTVRMQENETKTIKVSYWVEPAPIVDAEKNPLLHYTYTLQTGATWKGKIEEATISVALGNDVLPGSIVRQAPTGAKVSQDGKTLVWTMRDFKPTDNIEITWKTGAVAVSAK